MQKIIVAGQIQLPADAGEREDALEQINNALSVLASLRLTQDDGNSFGSFSPFMEIQQADGELKMIVSGNLA